MRRLATLLFLTFFVLAGFDAGVPGSAGVLTTREAAPTSFPTTQIVKVFVVWGSSNACGHGDAGGTPNTAPGTAYQWHRDGLQAPEPVDDPFPCYTPRGGANPDSISLSKSAWPAFAVRYSDPDVGLTDHILFMSSGAKGGSTLLDRDTPLDWSLLPGNVLFSEGVQAIQDAMDEARAMFPNPQTHEIVFGGVLWNQGNDFFHVFPDGTVNSYPWDDYRADLHAHLQAFADAVLADPNLASGRFYFINAGAFREDALNGEYYYAYDLEADVCSEYEFCSMIQESVYIKEQQVNCWNGGTDLNCGNWWTDDIHWGTAALNHIGQKTAERVYEHEQGDPFTWEVGIEVPQEREYESSEEDPPTRLDVYDDDGALRASFDLHPSIKNPDWRADFDGDDPTANWRPTWSTLSTEFLTFAFVRQQTGQPDEVLDRYVYVPTDAVYAATGTDFFRPDAEAGPTAVRFEVLTDEGAFEVKAGPGHDDGTSLERLGPFFEDAFAASYVLPYNHDAYCAAATGACTGGLPGYFLAPVDYLPTSLTDLRFTFADEADVLIPGPWGTSGLLAWDVAGLVLAFPESRRLVVEGALAVTDARLTAADEEEGWGGVVYRVGAEASSVVNVLSGSVVEHVRREPSGGLVVPYGSVAVAGRVLWVEGESEVRDGAGSVSGILATGAAVVTVTGQSEIRDNDGGGVYALGGARVTVTGQSRVEFNPGGGGVRADGYGTLIELEEALVLNNTGPGVRAHSLGQVTFANVLPALPTEVKRNAGGLYATSGTGGGSIDAGQCVGSEPAPCQDRTVHELFDNGALATTLYDAQSLGGSSLYAQGNNWDVAAVTDLNLQNQGSTLVVCPIVNGDCGSPGRQAGSPVRGGAAPQGDGGLGGAGTPRSGDVFALVEEAERARLSGDEAAFEIAAMAVVAAIDTSATADDRRAAFEATARLFAWAQPEGPLAALEALAAEPGEGRPWAQRALGVARASAEDYVLARAAADTLVAGVRRDRARTVRARAEHPHSRGRRG
jgi:hypothetical protein